ncbi:MAG TPA: methionyl-tRNA formyltransferase [Candidatus Saccharimonadales bacterium]|jgi:methionyl-tRNA formyltransferase
MTPSRGRLVFFGNERLVSGLPRTDAPVLRGLIAAGYDIAAVVASHSDGTSRSSRQLEVAQVAEQHGIPVLKPTKLGESADLLAAFKADAAVLVAYGRIIPHAIIELFPAGIINLHPSLLPRWRGPTPIETTILSGDKVAGVSIMRLSVNMDAGPIFAQANVTVKGDETKFELYERLSQLGTELLLNTLPQILDGSLTPAPQGGQGITYSRLIEKTDGTLNPVSDTAMMMTRKVRAYLGFPKSRLTIGAHDVIVTSARVASNPDDGALVVPCAGESYLEILELIAPSGRPMSGEAFLRGYKE